MKIITTVVVALFSLNLFALTNSKVAESPTLAHVMMIKSEAPDSTGNTTPGYCNATLIHQNLMVTAAHCVKLAYISGQKTIDIQVGQYKYITRKTDGVVVRVGYVVKHALKKSVNIELPRSLKDKLASRGEKATISPNEDFAMLWWNDETPEFKDIEAAQIVSTVEHNQIVQNINQYSFHPVTINFFSEMSTDTKRTSTLESSTIKWKGYLYSKANSRVEEGDSGAPLFSVINNKLKVFAVVKGRASTVFDNWDAYSAVGPHLCSMASSLPSFIKLESCK